MQLCNLIRNTAVGGSLYCLVERGLKNSIDFMNTLQHFALSYFLGFVHDGFRYRKRPTNLQKN